MSQMNASGYKPDALIATNTYTTPTAQECSVDPTTNTDSASCATAGGTWGYKIGKGVIPKCNF